MNVEIAERLAARRKEAGLSQEGLAEKLGVSRQAVSKWERSESSPDTDNLIALAKLYGVSLDDLLYVDGSIEEDVVFEQIDRAAERAAANAATQSGPAPSSGQVPGSGIPQAEASSANAASETPPAPSSTPVEDDTATSSSHASGWTSGKGPEKVHIGLDGIHVLDGEDYVHVSWRDGVHVKDSKDGDEVHVGWNGVHVKEGSNHGRRHGHRDEGTRSGEGSGRDWCAAGDDEGNTVAWTGDGVVINGEQFDNWHDANEKYGHGHGGSWGRPSGYTVNGEYFDTLEEARARYGSEVGKSIPVRKHYRMAGWLKFPYPLVVIIVYLLLGFMANEWGTGLFVFFTIPVYYMIGHAVESKKYAHFVGGLYPIAVTAWFLWMAFVLNQPHPAWVAFLTIPLVEWAVHWTSRWWRRRKKEADVIEVEAK
ncbi:helix-turn-helix transcriptional regulator [Raoultibacter phocaeensis]|uniref:helix-turn-helix transcriptional regulator n=1 Tax=Raoultibacter phocaeensis TaxID=2479841 RepID=UPI001118420A|nr:helix-turn-helix transcriptional regulator [Raoultibacter phocaeensis]